MLTHNIDEAIKTTMDPRFTLGEMITNQGGHSIVRHACSQGDCNYIAKIINGDRDNILNELLMYKHMSEVGLGPIIYDISLSDTDGLQSGTVIMKRYDGTLSDLIFLWQKDKNIDMTSILESVHRLVEQIHKLGIIHGDLNPNNILYTKDRMLIVTDFGNSVMSDSKELRDIDRKSLSKIMQGCQQIIGGEYYESADDFMMEWS